MVGARGKTIRREYRYSLTSGDPCLNIDIPDAVRVTVSAWTELRVPCATLRKGAVCRCVRIMVEPQTASGADDSDNQSE